MRKTLLTSLIVCMVALLSMLLMPAVHGTPPAPASGEWTYTPNIINEKWADGNLFRYGIEDSVWHGTFEGESDDVFTVVIHSSGFRYVEGLIYFTGTVPGLTGESGTLVIHFVGKGTPPSVTPPPVIWSGHWVILRGTGGLANLRGQGTWWGPPMNVDYSGKIHFE